MISRQTAETAAGVTGGAGPDLIGEFLAERTVAGPERRVGGRALFGAWRSWCRDVDETPGTEAAFATTMVKRGIETSTHGGRMTYLGLALTRAAAGGTR